MFDLQKMLKERFIVLTGYKNNDSKETQVYLYDTKKDKVVAEKNLPVIDITKFETLLSTTKYFDEEKEKYLKEEKK